MQNKRIEVGELERFNGKSKNNYSISDDDLDYLIKAIEHSERPIVLIGSGIRSANAVEDLKVFSENYSIPLTYSGSAPDIIGLEDPLSIGSVGMMGCSRAGNLAVQNSDLLLVFGSRLNTMTTGEDFQKFAREAKIIIVDIDSVEHSKESIEIDKLIIADLKDVLF